MIWHELTLHVPCEAIERAEALMHELGALSVTIADAGDAPIYEPLPGQTPYWPAVKITALFDREDCSENAFKALKSAFPRSELLATQLADRVWERQWMAHFKPMRFGQGTWIIPAGYAPVDARACNIHLDPGLAFGTGTHPTTALCLDWIDAHPMAGLELLDFGCGSGILAIAAARHGARVVHCTDIDPQAEQATCANAEKNRVSDALHIVATDALSTLPPLDGVMANVLMEPLLQQSDVFFELLKPGGFVILSGLLASQMEQIHTKYSNRYVDITHKIKDDWGLLAAHRPASV